MFNIMKMLIHALLNSDILLLSILKVFRAVICIYFGDNILEFSLVWTQGKCAYHPVLQVLAKGNLMK